MSQLIRYARACAKCSNCLDRARLLTQKLLKQGYVVPRLKSSLYKIYGCHHELVDSYELIFISQMRNDLLLFMQLLFPIYHDRTINEYKYV